MSRRRKLPALPPGYIRHFAVSVICTDGDQHSPARIADVTGAALPGEDPSVMWRQSEQGKTVTARMADDGWRTFTFNCRRCGRHLRLREPRLILAATALAKSGVGDGHPTLDISWRGLS